MPVMSSGTTSASEVSKPRSMEMVIVLLPLVSLISLAGAVKPISVE